jgi:hypothetical protein
MGEATLKIKEVTQDLTDPRRLRFVMQFTRDLTQLERDILPRVIARRFNLPAQAHGTDTVIIDHAGPGAAWFSLPHHKQRWKAAAAEAEAEAEKYLAQIGSAEGRAAVRDEETRRELAAID